jgi:puromycin-sensitive aminopeptidase
LTATEDLAVADAPSYRLPRTVVPERYELTLTPDLDEASFSGESRIRVRVNEAVTELVLNAIELDIQSAELADDTGTRVGGTVTLDETEQRATITLGQTVTPGTWNLHLTFTGILNDKLHGFYRSTFKDDDGSERTIATTQFEATDARRAFPCWDEPDFKATFAVTLIVDEAFTAISNGAPTSEHSLGNGKKQISFAETIPMSTYLVAFVVGPFELSDPRDVGGVPLRIASTPGKQRLTRFATEAGAAALTFLANYFEIPYPSDKIDHIAIPDFAFGAMENLGCVTYRETALLVDEQSASRLELQRVAEVIAHETAHMWFGDLVTMKWWNGIWLNEAFATFMELLAVDAFKPDWDVWVSFGAGRGAAMLTDGLRNTRPVEYPVGRPEEAEGMFDVLTYQKGAAVLRMLEQYLGAEPFRRGIVRYLNEHRFANTETTDLWDAIEAESGEPARAVMDSWIDQGGYPLVSVSAEGGQLKLSQERFLYAGGAGDERWQVPINLRYSVDGRVGEARVLLNDQSVEVELPGPPDWVLVNAGASGFYRVRYEPSLLRSLTAVMATELGALNRLGLVGDIWAAVLAGGSTLADFTQLAGRFDGETDPDVWAAVLGPLSLLDRIISDTDRPSLQAFVQRLAGPAFARLGWDVIDGEAERTGTLRARLLLTLGTIGADPQIRAEAASRHAAYLKDRSVLAADLVTAVVNVVAYAGGEAEYEIMHEQFRRATTPQDEIRYLYALAASEVPALLNRTLEMCLSSEVRTQDAPYLLGSILGSRAGHGLAWQFLTERWDDLLARFPRNSIPRMLESVAAIADPALAPAIHQFLDAHPVPQGERQLAQARERLDINVAFGQRITATLAAELSA